MKYGNKSNDALIAEISKLKKIVKTLQDNDSSDNRDKNRNEERYKYLFHYSGEPIILHNIAGEIIDVNQAAIDEFHIPRKKFIGREITSLYPTYEHSKLPGIVNRVMDKKYIRCEIHCIKSTGEIFPAEVTSNKITVSDDIIIKTIIRDISDIKRALISMISSEEKYRNVVERSIDGICIVQNNTIKYVNNQLAKIGGYTVREIVNQPFAPLIDPKDLQRVKTKYQQFKSEKKKEQRFEVAIVHNSGSLVDTEITISRMMYKGDNAVLVFVRDLTEHNKMLRELHKIQKLESIGVLAGGIAHDFNNILSSVLGNMSLVVNHLNEVNEIKEVVQETISVAERGKHLTNQLLTFSKGGDPIMKSVPVAELIENSLQLALAGTNTTFSLQVHDDVWDVHVDEGQIHHVIHNVVINSLQAMAEGGKLALNITNTRADADHVFLKEKCRYVEIDITDSGPGIPREHLSKIFDPFFSTKHKCRGLGLSTAYSIIKKHNGYIFIESDEKKGTTVKIYLPAIKHTSVKTEKPLKTEKKSARKEAVFSGRVLIMDDEEMVCKTMGRILNAKGYDIEMAKDGDEAIRIFETARTTGVPFDMIIMDLTVPGGMGGKEAIRKIREKDRKIKAIVSSGYSNDPVMSNCIKYGFNACLTKPYRFEDISDVLEMMKEPSL